MRLNARVSGQDSPFAKMLWPVPSSQSVGVVAVRKVLNEQHITQREVARAMCLSEGALSDKLRGRRRITLDDLERLARHLGITLGQLLEPPALLVDDDESEQR